MPFQQCIISARDQGALTPEEAGDLIRRYEAHVSANRGSADPRGAEGLAKDGLMRELSDEAARKERLAALAAARIDDLRAGAAEYREPGGGANIVRYFLGVIENRNNLLVGAASVVGRRDSLIGVVHGRIEQHLYQFRRRFLSSTGERMNLARLDRVVDEAHGAATGDHAATGFLGAWRAAADDLVTMFNDAGGSIARLESYFPQAHDARRMAASGEDAWVAFISERLDVSRMRDPLTGGVFDPARLDEALRVVWRRIVTDGAIDLVPSGQPRGRGALANQRQDHRFLVFRDATAWRDYARAFGSDDVFALMMGHLHGLAKDVSALQVLGPNPNATVEWMKQMIEAEAAQAKVGAPSLYTGSLETSMTGRIATDTGRIDRLWQLVNGSGETGNLFAAQLMETARNVATAANLSGTAVTSVLGDPFQQMWARRFAGIPQLTYLLDLQRQLFSTAARRDAVRAGLILEDAMDHLATSLRDLSWGAASREASAYLPDRVFTWTGLTPWTRTQRRGNGVSYMFEAADRTGQSLAEIAADGAEGARFARQLGGFGITAADWDLIRSATGIHHGDAGRLLRPVDVLDALGGGRAGMEVALRYAEAVHAFVEEAVPSGTFRAKAALGRAAPKGEVSGEIVRQSTSYLTYPTSFLLSMAAAVSHEAAAGGGGLAGLGRGAGFLAQAVIGLTIGGALIIQARALRQGRDPVDAGSVDFWARSFAQGGALGFYGDWLFADYERGPADTAARFAGPVGGMVGQALAVVNVQGFTSDHDINRSARAVDFARRNLPVQNMWWLRPATDRLIWDRLQRLADPRAMRNWDRKAAELRRATGQGIWWDRGEALPGRAPDFSLVLGR